ncbi:unnamed protein product [Calicophoron daubneyi]|uniref:Uncharacterized protein n=1 Tax=Calicophoron daubneyi TaxID=300641 RepID=A0AAV2T2Y9_CALDB
MWLQISKERPQGTYTTEQSALSQGQFRMTCLDNCRSKGQPTTYSLEKLLCGQLFGVIQSSLLSTILSETLVESCVDCESSAKTIHQICVTWLQKGKRGTWRQV